MSDSIYFGAKMPGSKHDKNSYTPKMDTFLDNQKRGRQLFNQIERQTLFRLVKEAIPILESRANGKEAMLAKQRCWNTIYQSYNSHPNFTRRNLSQLKKCWENIKSRKKRRGMSIEIGGETIWKPPTANHVKTTAKSMVTNDSTAKISQAVSGYSYSNKISRVNPISSFERQTLIPKSEPEISFTDTIGQQAQANVDFVNEDGIENSTNETYIENGQYETLVQESCGNNNYSTNHTRTDKWAADQGEDSTNCSHPDLTTISSHQDAGSQHVSKLMNSSRPRIWSKRSKSQNVSYSSLNSQQLTNDSAEYRMTEDASIPMHQSPAGDTYENMGVGDMDFKREENQMRLRLLEQQFQQNAEEHEMKMRLLQCQIDMLEMQKSQLEAGLPNK